MENTTNAALRRRPREYEREREEKAERKYCEKALEERLGGTFQLPTRLLSFSHSSQARRVSPQRTLS